jgi:hypothetical protein
MANEIRRRNPSGLYLGALPSPDDIIREPKPETYRLPKGGQSDPYFGLRRSWYYSAEAHGILTLIRLRNRGKQRGVTLVGYDDVAAIIDQARRQARSVRSTHPRDSKAFSDPPLRSPRKTPPTQIKRSKVSGLTTTEHLSR